MITLLVKGNGELKTIRFYHAELFDSSTIYLYNFNFKRYI